ncbi:MAG: hypothetical protein HYV27_21515 [Candidatus Hydrogenedentes bacterium]|nr:hypothetical protein [Candidatus Hydrogenedentota bacterium]
MLNRKNGLGSLAALMAVLLWSTSAAAFFPIGGFDVGEVLRIARWKVGDFDSNNDGLITPDEGLEYLVEKGPRGFTAAEIAEIEQAFQIWEDVPTSYAAFKKVGEPTDPIISGGAPDQTVTIQMEVTGFIDADGDGFPDPDVLPDPVDVITGAVGNGVLGVTFVGFAADESVIDVGNDQLIISAGTVVDMDIIIDPVAHRVPEDGTEAPVDLLSTMVHEIGHLLGLDHPALNNLRATAVDPANPTIIGGFVENEVFWFTQPSGVSRLMGVTPTMFPILFETENASGDRFDGGLDLAPDDISAISWMYPRGDQSNFFNLRGEARTQVRTGSGAPSIPLTGGHIVAWADHDDDPGTSRIPMFSTMSGLYEIASNDYDEGLFNLIGLWKQFEVPGGGGSLFNPTYTFTMITMNQTGLERQAPPAILAPDIDTIQGPLSFSTVTRATDDYTSFAPSEVFHEVENVIDVSNKDVGTPMVWSFDRDTLISDNTGKTLSSILSDGRPVFGDPNDACPLNIISGDTGGTTTTGAGATLLSGNNRLRGFRDNVLLRSGTGMALVNVYYVTAPNLAQLLSEQPALRAVFTAGVTAFYLFLEHGAAGALLAACAVMLAWAVRRRMHRAGLFLALVAALSAVPDSAEARLYYMTQARFVASATDIFTGTVESTSSRFLRTGHIVTDVVISVDTVAKGRQNKQSQVTVTVPGGRTEGLVMRASEMPSFSEGERVLVYVRELDNVGYVINGGVRGKVTISVNAKTGEEELQADNLASALDLKAAEADAGATGNKQQEDDAAPSAEATQESLDAEVEVKTSVPLSSFMEHLKELVREERRN